MRIALVPPEGVALILPRIVQIERASFSVPWRPEDFLSPVPGHSLAVLFGEDGLPDGYGCFFTAADEAEVTNLAVDPEKRRVGIGAEILDFMLGKMRDAGAVRCYLEVRESNAPARALYASRDFRTVGVRRGYYRQPIEDALVMVREL